MSDALSIASGGDDLDLIELADEEQVLHEIAGRVLETYVYKFMGSDGKEVVGLSKVGVDWACREYAKRNEIIRIIDWDIVPDPVDPANNILVVVEAQRFKIEDGKEIALDNRLGTKRQPIKTKRRDGTVVSDSNFVEKAFSKASRNSRMALLPHGFVKEMIAMALKAGQVKILGRGAPPATQQPKPAPKPAQAPPQAAAPTTPPPSTPASTPQAVATTAAPSTDKKTAAPASSSPKTPAAAKQAAPAQSAAAKPAQAAPHSPPAKAEKPAAPAAPATEKADGKPDIQSIRQHVVAGLKKHGDSKDDGWRRVLKALLGDDKLHSIKDDKLRSLHEALKGIDNGWNTLELGEDGRAFLFRLEDGVQLFPENGSPAAPAPAPPAEATVHEEAAAADATTPEPVAAEPAAEDPEGPF